MRYMWLAGAFAVTLVMGLLVGIILGSGERGSAPPPRTVTVEKTVSEGTPPNPETTTKGSDRLDEARAAFERAVEGFGNPNLEVTEVMEFANNYYAEVEEKDTGIGAMELLINRPGGRVYQEPGPDMMWNTKYGMMGGYRSSSASASKPTGATGDEMPVGPEQAMKIADAYLSRVSPGTRAEEPTKFYGYYTIDTEKDGKASGMLSVNGYSGEVWYHSWHGQFVAKQEGT